MAAITQTQKDQTIRDLDFLRGKLQALGLDPVWASGALDHNMQGDGALTYGLVKDEIDAAVARIDTVFGILT